MSNRQSASTKAVFGKCPHCGDRYNAQDLRDGKIPTHDYPRPCRSVCPGSGQPPRSLYDSRPLGKDMQ